MRIGSIVLSVLCLSCAVAARQSETPPDSLTRERTAYNNLYVELGGNGIFYSVNYDRLFSEAVSARLGVMFISGDFFDGNLTLTLIPVMANYLVRIDSAENRIEVGVGPMFALVRNATPSTGRFPSSRVIGTATIGYRFAPYSGGFNFRIGVTPIFGAGEFLPWGGVSVGYGF